MIFYNPSGTYSRLAFIIIVSVILLLNIDTATGAQLRAGVARVNITNLEVGGIVRDSVYARVLALENGNTRVVIISVDALGTGFFLDSVRLKIQKDLSINPENVIINASHLHGRRPMCPDIDKRIVVAVKIALRNMVPVNVGVGVGHEDRIMENRRLKLNNKKEWTIRHANPLPPDEEVAATGPADPEIGILKLDRKNGKSLAVVYNFACHPYQDSWRPITDGTSADFTGYASGVIENNLDNNALALFLQGCGGDMTTVLYKDTDNPRDAEPLGNMLGLSTLQALKKIPYCKNTELKVINETIWLPRRTDIPQRLAQLKVEQSELLRSLRGTSLNMKTFVPLYVKYNLSGEYPSYYSHRYLHEMMIGRNDLEGLDSENRRNIDKYLRNIYAMEKLARIQDNMAILNEQQELLNRVGKTQIKIEVIGLRIGDFVLITFPGEAVVQIGLNIKNMSPHKYTFVTAYTNENGDAGHPPMEEGNIGYAPTADQFKGEAYEDMWTQLSPEWQKIYEEKVMEILGKL